MATKEKYYLFCAQRQQPYGGWEDVEAYTLREIKEILIDYHSIDQPAGIKRYSLYTLLDIYEWQIYLDENFEQEIDYNKLLKIPKNK